MSQPKVKLRTSGTQFEFIEGQQTLLEHLEINQVQVEYQCRSGYCGSCRTRLLKGRVAYHNKPLALIQDGEILPCCCIPLVDIELEI